MAPTEQRVVLLTVEDVLKIERRLQDRRDREAARLKHLDFRFAPSIMKRARKRFVRGHYFVTQAAFNAMAANNALPRGFQIV